MMPLDIPITTPVKNTDNSVLDCGEQLERPADRVGLYLSIPAQSWGSTAETLVRKT